MVLHVSTIGYFVLPFIMQQPKNKREIDRVHNYVLYIATVSIKHKVVDPTAVLV